MPHSRRIPFRLEPTAGVWSSAQGKSRLVWMTGAGVEGSGVVGTPGPDCSATLQFEDLPWAITVQVADVNGVWQIVGINIGSSDLVLDVTRDPPRLTYEGPKSREPTITKDLLQQLPLRQLRDAAVRLVTGAGDFTEPFRLERPATGWDDAHYRAVAEVYRNAPGAPLNAISARWSVSRAAASKWVKEARVRGFLGYPTRRGVAGASEPESPVKRKRAASVRKGATQR